MPASNATGYSQRRSVPSPVSSCEPVDALDLGRAEQRHVERHERDRQQGGAEPVDARPVLRPVVAGQRPPRCGQPDDRQRDVEPELPLPREQAHQHRAVERAPHPAHRLDRPQRAERPRAAAFGIDVTDDGQRHRHHRSAAEGSEDAAEQEPAERLVERRSKRGSRSSRAGTAGRRRRTCVAGRSRR